MRRMARRATGENRCGWHLFHDVKQCGYIGSFAHLERRLGSLAAIGKEQSSDVSPIALKLWPDSKSRNRWRDFADDCRSALRQAERLLTARQARKVDALKHGSTRLPRSDAWRCASTVSSAARDRHHWMRGSTMRLIRTLQVTNSDCGTQYAQHQGFDRVEPVVRTPRRGSFGAHPDDRHQGSYRFASLAKTCAEEI
jgi:hypothetical protein